MPEVNPSALEKELRSLIAEIIEVEEEKITPKANFVEDLGMDSMMALEILASIEKKYKIRVPEENLTKLNTLRDAVDLITKFMAKK